MYGRSGLTLNVCRGHERRGGWRGTWRKAGRSANLSTGLATGAASGEETRRAAPRRRGRRGGGVGRGEGGIAASGRRGGDEDDEAASRRRGSGVGRGEGKGIEGEGEGERGDSYLPTGTSILMAHLTLVRHKYIHTNGAPHPGAPLVFFFLISARANRLSSTLPDPHQVPSTSSTGQ